MNAGYKVSLSHAAKNSIKTDAPNDVLWVRITSSAVWPSNSIIQIKCTYIRILANSEGGKKEG